MREPLLAERTYPGTGDEWSRRYMFRLRVVGGLNHLRGNDRPYFSITADLDRRPKRGGRWTEDAGGCLHDDIERMFPGRFSDLIALHLSDDTGAPMHALDNAVYHAGGTRWKSADVPVLRRHLRLTDDDRATESELIFLAGHILHPSDDDDRELARRKFAELIDGLRPRWKREADECIARHGLKVYGDAPMVQA